jgi:hypothetical protein
MQDEIRKILKLKKQSMIIEGKIRDHHHLIDVKHANNLHKCTDVIGINGEKITRYNACGSPYCPICTEYKRKKQRSIFYDIYNHLVENNLLKNYLFYHLTLNMSECHVNNVSEATEQIKLGRDKLNKFFKFIKAVSGAAINIHYKIKDEDTIKLHLHIFIMVNSKNNFFNKITEDKWQIIWMDCLGVNYYPDVDIRPIGTDENITSHAFSNVLYYGLKHIKDEDIKDNFKTYIKLRNKINKERKTEYYGDIKTLKRLVENKYKSRDKIIHNEEKIKIMKFNGKGYKKSHDLISDI